MELSTLTAISPIDGRYGKKLENLRKYASEFALMHYRTLIEVRWWQALASHPQITEIQPFNDTAQHLLINLIENFSEEDAQRIKTIEKNINHDLKAVEYFIKEKVSGNNELTRAAEFIHFACTSEDINNTAYALMLQAMRHELLIPQIETVIATLRRLAHEYAADSMLARTHGQPATPTTMGKELANFVKRGEQQLQQISQVKILAKFNGAVGNFNAHTVAYPEINWPDFTAQFIHDLGLTYHLYSTQIEPHDYMAELFQAIMRFNNIMLDCSRDIWMYISLGYFQQQSKAHEVGSSVMPHKINPIDFENAEGNLGIANALLDHFANKLPISRWQRDLSDSTVLRNIGVAFAHCLLAYQSLAQGLNKITLNSAVLNQDLQQHSEVLAEALQTVMRRYGITDSYDKVKALTRGQTINAKDLRAFIQNLELPPEVKERLLQLTPSQYVGMAAELAMGI